MFPELRDTVLLHKYKKGEDTEQEKEVTRKQNWEKYDHKGSTTISTWKGNFDFQL